MTTKEYKKIPKQRAEELGGVLKGLSHPLRLRLINLLCARDYTVSELCKALGEKQSLVSQHLSPLRMLGLVKVDRTGGKATYSLAEPQLRNLLDCLTSCH